MALTDSLVAYYALDGNGVDATGRGNDLTNSGASWASGLIGSAADFESGESDYLYRADNADLSMGDIDFTVAAWVKAESWPAAVAFVGKGDWNLAATSDYALAYFGAGGGFRFIVSKTAAVSVYATSIGVPPSTGVWYFVVGWHDSVSNTISVQVNNGTVHSAAHTVGVNDTAQEFGLGRLRTSATGVQYFDGLIDMVGLWKRVLTTAEITQLYNAGAGLAYPFTTSTPLMMQHHHAMLANRR